MFAHHAACSAGLVVTHATCVGQLRSGDGMAVVDQQLCFDLERVYRLYLCCFVPSVNRKHAPDAVGLKKYPVTRLVVVASRPCSASPYLPVRHIDSHLRSLPQGRSPSDVSDIDTVISEDQPTPKLTSKLQRVVVQKGPAAVHPAQRRGSVMPLKSESGGAAAAATATKRGSTISEPGRGWDVPIGVISEA